MLYLNVMKNSFINLSYFFKKLKIFQNIFLNFETGFFFKKSIVSDMISSLFFNNLKCIGYIYFKQ